MRNRGFTLIELMVSIALMLLVMIGVNVVFTTTSATIGAGQAFSSISRDDRAMQAVMARDLGTGYSNFAPLIIKAEQLYQFNSLKDQQADVDGDEKTISLTGGPETAVVGADYGPRSHRHDRLALFVQQSQRRQTGNNGVFTANMSSREAWVWYGHLRQPDNTGLFAAANFFNPGAGTAQTNPNNFFGSQWILGRWATLLVTPDAAGDIYDRTGGTKQDFYQRPTSPVATSVAPLSFNTTSTAMFETATALPESRYDLAGTNIEAFKAIVAGAIGAGNANWYTDMMMGPTTRYRCVPFAPRPLTSKSMAQTSPIMAVGTSQFIVEYAGDFLKQNPADGSVTGKFTDAVPSTDGDIDYIINAGTRSIRWYGMPRNVNITDDPAGGIKIVGNSYTSTEVIPLRDLLGSPAPFEQQIPAAQNIAATAAKPDYGVSGGVPSGGLYICAWSPADQYRPKLVRIIYTLEDPNGRLPSGQTFEHVYAVP